MILLLIAPVKDNSFFLFSILSNLETGNSSLNQFAFGIFILSIKCLLCFLNISFYLISYYLIQKGNYENKYPSFRKLINYYKNILKKTQGQYPPISTEGTIELWKYAQNTDIKANTSLITKSMNPIIIPFLTSFVWWPR